MEEKIINKINDIAIQNKTKQEEKMNIEKLLMIYEKNPLELLDKKNSSLFDSIYSKIIPNFYDNQSIKNAKEIYIAYQQFGSADIENYLIQINQLLLYLKKVAIITKENIQIENIEELLNIKEQLLTKKLYEIDSSLLEIIIKKLNLTKEEYQEIITYIKENEIEIENEEIFKDTPNKNDLKESYLTVFNIAKQIFINEIDKLPSYEEKIKKIEELIQSNIYNNNNNQADALLMLSIIIKEEIEEEKQLLQIVEENEQLELKENIKNLYRIFNYLKEKEQQINDQEEIEDSFFDYNNHKNKIIYLNPSILKDIENISDPKTIKDIYSLLIKIKEDNIPIKSFSKNTMNLTRTIQRIRNNSNNAKGRIYCELLGNNIYGIIYITEKKDSIVTKQERETITERLKNYNKDTISSNENQYELDKAVYDLLSSKLNHHKIK